MKITKSQLLKIIKEEIETELHVSDRQDKLDIIAQELGNKLQSDGLAGGTDKEAVERNVFKMLTGNPEIQRYLEKEDVTTVELSDLSRDIADNIVSRRQRD